MSTYSVWGWGGPDDEPRDAADLAPYVTEVLGFPAQPPEEPTPLAPLATPRISLPETLATFASREPADRARHGLGRSYRDVVRGLRGRPDAVPDFVVRPTTDENINSVLDWCTDSRVAVVPFGGGTSVVGGVEPRVGDEFAGVISLDLARCSGVVEIDATSLAARVRAGTTGPALEEGLRQSGLTARFFPQSFERSTVGGWIATRAGGHFATRLTHIDDLVESVRALTPAGVWESRRLPASGAGPSPDRLLLGSEGTLGVITEAWVRVQPRPVHRWSALYGCADFSAAAHAVRALVQSGSLPSACRLIDAPEARITSALTTGEHALVLGFESTGRPIESDAQHADALLRDHGLRCVEAGERGGSGDAWRSAFLRAPYVRDVLVVLGVLVETFETAITWDRFDHLVDSVRAATTAAMKEVCGAGTVTCRLTHCYADGAAPYFTVFAPARRGSELAQWADIKAAASQAIIDAGGTITHHHAVGRDHLPWYAAQRPEPFATALRAAKQQLDPSGILNPGVLLP